MYKCAILLLVSLLTAVRADVQVPLYNGPNYNTGPVEISNIWNNTVLEGVWFQPLKITGSFPFTLSSDGPALTGDAAAARLPVYRFSGPDYKIGTNESWPEGIWGGFSRFLSQPNGSSVETHQIRLPFNASTTNSLALGADPEKLAGRIGNSAGTQINPYVRMRIEKMTPMGFRVLVDYAYTGEGSPTNWTHTATFEAREDVSGVAGTPPDLLEEIQGWRSEWNQQRAWLTDVLGPGDTGYTMQEDLHRLVEALAPDTSPIVPGHGITAQHITAGTMVEDTAERLDGPKIPAAIEGYSGTQPPWTTKEFSLSLTFMDWSWNPTFTVDLAPVQSFLTLLKAAQLALIGIWSMQYIYEEVRR
jgi:hypothetical protein